MMMDSSCWGRLELMRARDISGIILIVTGILFWVGSQFGLFLGIGTLWPLLILGIGIAFEVGYFTSMKVPGLLVPGGIFITLGVLFFFESLTHWQFSEYTWPAYPLSVAVGLLELYLFSERSPALLIPVLILGGLAALAWLTMIFGALALWISWGSVIPLVLIGLGLFLFLQNKTR